MKKKMLTSVLILGSLFFACNRTTQQTTVISPPFSKAAVALQEHIIDPATDEVITFESGTTIEIPANTIVDKNGDPVTEPVRVEYEEYHNSIDILVSGIPMKYDSAGVSYHFETAGMFDLKAFVDEEPVFIAEGKEIEVNFMSEVQGQYNFYALDETTGSWSYLATPQGQPLEEEDNNFMPAKADDSKLVIDLDVDYREFPELQVFEELLWQYSGQENPDEAVFDEIWTDMALTPTEEQGVYNLTLSRNGQKTQLKVQPVLSEADYEAAAAKWQQKLAAYDAAVVQQQERREWQNQQQNVRRSFAVSNFGIYNYDRQYARPEMVRLMADFEFSEDIEINKKELEVFLLTANDRAVIKYPYYTWEKFAFAPSDHNTLVAVLPGDRVALFTNEDFNKVRRTSRSHTFTMRVVNKKIEDIKDLQGLLQMS